MAALTVVGAFMISFPELLHDKSPHIQRFNIWEQIQIQNTVMVANWKRHFELGNISVKNNKERKAWDSINQYRHASQIFVLSQFMTWISISYNLFCIQRVALRGLLILDKFLTTKVIWNHPLYCLNETQPGQIVHQIVFLYSNKATKIVYLRMHRIDHCSDDYGTDHLTSGGRGLCFFSEKIFWFSVFVI